MSYANLIAFSLPVLSNSDIEISRNNAMIALLDYLQIERILPTKETASSLSFKIPTFTGTGTVTIKGNKCATIQTKAFDGKKHKYLHLSYTFVSDSNKEIGFSSTSLADFASTLDLFRSTSQGNEPKVLRPYDIIMHPTNRPALVTNPLDRESASYLKYKSELLEAMKEYHKEYAPEDMTLDDIENMDLKTMRYHLDLFSEPMFHGWCVPLDDISDIENQDMLCIEPDDEYKVIDRLVSKNQILDLLDKGYTVEQLKLVVAEL